MRKERQTLSGIYQRMNKLDGVPGLDYKEFKEFVSRLPDYLQTRFKPKRQTFDSYAVCVLLILWSKKDDGVMLLSHFTDSLQGDDDNMDYKEFQIMITNVAVSEAQDAGDEPMISLIWRVCRMDAQISKVFCVLCQQCNCLGDESAFTEFQKGSSTLWSLRIFQVASSDIMAHHPQQSDLMRRTNSMHRTYSASRIVNTNRKVKGLEDELGYEAESGFALHGRSFLFGWGMAKWYFGEGMAKRPQGPERQEKRCPPTEGYVYDPPFVYDPAFWIESVSAVRCHWCLSIDRHIIFSIYLVILLGACWVTASFHVCNEHLALPCFPTFLKMFHCY